MRIIAGRFGGRRISAPPGTGTRPTNDRVREGLFSALASRFGGTLQGVTALDAFAGSGALGLEAVSRGARCVLVERDRAAADTIDDNISSLGAEGDAVLVRGDVRTLARRGTLPSAPYALLLLDPPYRIDATEVRGLIEGLDAHGALADDVVVAWEHETGSELPCPSGFTSVSRKRYGTTEIDILVAERGSHGR